MSISIEVPGWRSLALAHLAIDYNGTVALDGHLVDGIAGRLAALAGQVRIHVLTADTFGRARRELLDLDCKLIVLDRGNEHIQKEEYVKRLGAEAVAAIGNGRNDLEMLKRAALAIAVIGGEGAAAETLAAADIVVADAVTALNLLLNPRRILATLRS